MVASNAVVTLSPQMKITYAWLLAGGCVSAAAAVGAVLCALLGGGGGGGGCCGCCRCCGWPVLL